MVKYDQNICHSLVSHTCFRCRNCVSMCLTYDVRMKTSWKIWKLSSSFSFSHKSKRNMMLLIVWHVCVRSVLLPAARKTIWKWIVVCCEQIATDSFLFSSLSHFHFIFFDFIDLIWVNRSKNISFFTHTPPTKCKSIFAISSSSAHAHNRNIYACIYFFFSSVSINIQYWNCLEHRFGFNKAYTHLHACSAMQWRGRIIIIMLSIKSWIHACRWGPIWAPPNRNGIK